MLIYHFQSGKVSEDFVWRGVGSDPVLVLHHLGIKRNRHETCTVPPQTPKLAASTSL